MGGLEHDRWVIRTITGSPRSDRSNDVFFSYLVYNIYVRIMLTVNRLCERGAHDLSWDLIEGSYSESQELSRRFLADGYFFWFYLGLS